MGFAHAFAPNCSSVLSPGLYERKYSASHSLQKRLTTVCPFTSIQAVMTECNIQTTFSECNPHKAVLRYFLLPLYVNSLEMNVQSVINMFVN